MYIHSFLSWISFQKLAGWVCYHLHSSFYGAAVTGGPRLSQRGLGPPSAPGTRCLWDPLSVGAHFNHTQLLRHSTSPECTPAPGSNLEGLEGVLQASGSVCTCAERGRPTLEWHLWEAGLIPGRPPLPALPGVPWTTPLAWQHQQDRRREAGPESAHGHTHPQ